MIPEKYLPDGVVLGGGVVTTGGTTILSLAAGQSLNVAPLRFWLGILAKFKNLQNIQICFWNCMKLKFTAKQTLKVAPLN